MKLSKFPSWFAPLNRPSAAAKLAVESLDLRVLPSASLGHCFAMPVCRPVACEVAHPKPACNGAIEHATPPSHGDQHSVCLFGANIGKDHQKSSHGKADACSKSNGGSQKSSHGKVDACTPPAPKPTPCPAPTPPVACTPPAPKPTPCPAPATPPDSCSVSHGGSQKSSHGEKADRGHATNGHAKSHGSSKTAHQKSSHGHCYDDGYAMPGRASDMVRNLCGLGCHA